jgi:hypothetical protein
MKMFDWPWVIADGTTIMINAVMNDPAVMIRHVFQSNAKNAIATVKPHTLGTNKSRSWIQFPYLDDRYQNNSPPVRNRLYNRIGTAAVKTIRARMT